ncbi:MAG: sigma-70 family RNA polymerase sigma factor [Cytophagaceae bacterium]|jgi:RNA polymerase sigma factor (sigma-70 family)|nr:sigma-70 family RNA polymerase sigma factor [Cytophagaceae bacterium]
MGKYQQDTDWILAIRQDDPEALESLYKAYFPMILRFITQNSGLESDARDIFQEAVILFYEKVKSDSLVLTCSIKTYLYAVCKKAWLKHLYKSHRYMLAVNETEFDEQVEPEEFWFSDEWGQSLEKLQESLLSLGEPCRGLLVDFYVGQLNMQELSVKYHYTNADNAKNQKYKCLQRLKKIFFKE